MMNQNQKKEEEKQTYFIVKQELDERRIQGVVTKQTAPLIFKLLRQIRDLEAELERKNHDSTFQNSRYGQQQAVSYQLRQITLENNQLRSEFIQMTDQIEYQKLKLQDFCEEGLSKKVEHFKNSDQLNKIFKEREEELKQDLAQVTYKYNELMDLLHQEPTKERQYIKRLLKHKQIHSSQNNNHKGNIGGTKEEITQRELLAKTSLLEAQLLSRNKEIQRLQVKFADQCESIACHKWQNRQEVHKITLLQQEISALQEENSKFKKKYVGKRALVQQKREINERVRSQQKQILKEGMKANEKNKANHFNKQSQKRKSFLQKAQEQYNSPRNLDKNENHTQKTSNAKNQYFADSSNSKVNLKKSNQIPQNRKKFVSPTQKEGKRKGVQQNFMQNKAIREHLNKNVEENSGQRRKVESNEKRPSNYERNENIIQRESKSPTYNYKPSSKVINKNKNIHSEQFQSNQFIINQNKNEYINLNAPDKSSKVLQQKLAKMQKQLKEVSEERNQLRQKLIRKQRENDRIKEDSLDQQFDQYHMKKEYHEEEGQNDKRMKQKLKEAQQNLIKVNQENISLQKRLNEALKANGSSLKKQQKKSSNQMSQDDEINDDEIYRLRRQVQRLKNELAKVVKEKESLSKKLFQMDKSLGMQSKQMNHFEKSVDKKYRDASVSP